MNNDVETLSDEALRAVLDEVEEGSSRFIEAMREKARRVQNGTPASTDGPAPVGILASEVEAEPVEWLWSSRIPLGEITILDGDPGTGKSTLLTAVAAHVTTGRGLPDHHGDPIEGGAVYVTTEDSQGRTILPRLEAAGAITGRVLLVESVPDGEDDDRPFVLPDDTSLLEQAVRHVGARLVVIDPLMAHLGGSINAHRDSDVRRALAPLAALAHRLSVAVVVVRHLNKTGGTQAIYRGGGSIGIVGAARAGLLLVEHPEQKEVRVLAPVKNNLAPFPPSLSFSLEQATDHNVARVEWLGKSDLSADELLQGRGRGRPDEKRQEARAFLEEILSDGPVPAQEVKDEAEECGITTMTLRRAKDALNVESEKQGFEGPWMWKLPDEEADDAPPF